VRRTRRLLWEALVALVSEKTYDRVTVQDLIDRADLSRATFYAHFRDKDDLLLSGLDELEQLGSVQAVLEHIEAHRLLYRGSIGGRAGTLVLRQMRRRLTALVRHNFQEVIDRMGLSPPVPTEVTAEFAVGAFLGVMWWWLEQDDPLPAPRMSELLELLSTPAIDTGLGLLPPPEGTPSGSG
jgi:AcrR family transcriptional regulator